MSTNPALTKVAVPLLRWTLGIVVFVESLLLALAAAGIQLFGRPDCRNDFDCR